MEGFLAAYKTNHLQLRDGVFYFRAVVPKDLAVKTSPREIRLSLKTRYPEEARRLCRILSSELELLVNKLKLMPDITKEKIYEIARKHLQWLMDYTNDIAPVKVAVLQYNRNRKEAISKVAQEVKVGVYSDGTIHQAKRYLKKEGIENPNEDSPEFTLLCDVIARARLEHARIMESIGENGHPAEPQDPVFKGIDFAGFIAEQLAVGGKPKKPKKSLEELIKLFIETNTVTNEKWNIKTENLYRRMFKIFLATLDDTNIDITEVKRDKIRDFQDLIPKLPVNMDKSKACRGKDMKEIIKLAGTLPKIAPATQNSYQACFRNFWSWCANRDYLDSNPCPPIPRVKLGNQKENTLPFSIEMLQKIFESPIYKGCHSNWLRYRKGEVKIIDATYWIPLLALYSGMREGEILQLQMKDFKVDKGISYLDINGDGIFTDEPQVKKRTKNPQSARKAPIHPELEKLGFIEYLTKLKKVRKPNDRIFSEWRIGRKANITHYYSKSFTSFLESIKIKTPKIKFHSFRNNAVDALKNKDVTESSRNEVFGHDSGGTGDKVTIALPFTYILSRQSEQRIVEQEPVNNILIDGLPAAAMEKHTRIGKSCLHEWTFGTPAIFDSMVGKIPNARMAGVTAWCLFSVESASLSKQLIYDGHDEALRIWLEAFTCTEKFTPADLDALLKAVTDNLAGLNFIRTKKLRQLTADMTRQAVMSL